MDKLSVAWSSSDEYANIERYGICFKEAREVVLNTSSLKIKNVLGDYSFIGPNNNLSKVLVVFCKNERGLRKIINARMASKNEENAYFRFLAEGDLS